MCRVGHCYWYQEGPAATFLLAAHHRFEIFFSTCKGVQALPSEESRPETFAAAFKGQMSVTGLEEGEVRARG